MKFFLSFLLGLSSFSTFAQNWSLFNAKEKFIYKYTWGSDISDVLWADSFHVSGSDTTFFLNKQFRRFSHNSGGYAAQPPFLREIIIKRGAVFLFVANGDTLRIEPQKVLGGVWSYSSTVSAEITAIHADTVFGHPDSVKTVTVSNGRIILISKNFGILKDYDRDLIGVQGRNAGKTFWDLYDFEIGDVFVRSFSEDSDPYWPTSEWQEREEVFDKYWQGDTLVYNINGQIRRFTERNLPLPHQPMPAHPCFTGIFPQPVVFLKAYVDSTGKLLLYRTEDEYGQPPLWSPSSPDTFSYLGDWTSYYGVAYKEGFGLIGRNCHQFETFYEESLTGYIKDRDTSGCVTPPCVTIQKQLPTEPPVYAFPNPVDATVGVLSKHPVFSIDVFNIQGQFIFHKNLQGETSFELDINNLFPGFYFLKVKLQDNFAYVSIVKK